MTSDTKQNSPGSLDMPILVSSPGKIILHGEHAVVYGKTALAAGLNLRSYLRLQQRAKGQLHLHLPDIDVEGSWDVKELQEKFSDLLHRDIRMSTPPSQETLRELRLILGYGDVENTKCMAVMAFLYLYLSIAGKDGKLPILDLVVSSALPPAAGLGSSAAYSVCLAAALLTLVKLISPKPVSGGRLGWSKADLDVINAWAFEGERVIHGNPSGIDNAISVHGGLIEYRSKVITPVESMPELSILLVNTKVPRSTKELVAGVRKRYDNYPKIYSPILDSIEEISQECKQILQTVKSTDAGCDHSAFKNLENLVDINQQLLGVIGVSHQSVNNICRSAAAYDIHAKLTGAGGGGCVFALLPPYVPRDSITSLQQDLHFHNYESWITSLGAPGVMMHESKEALLNGGFLIPDSFLI